MTLGGVVLPSRRQREKEAAARIGLGLVIGVGWHDGPVLLISMASGRRGEAVRKERRRVEVMAGRAGAAEVVCACFRDGAAVSVRRQMALSLEAVRVSGDLFGVDSAAFTVALVSAASAVGVRELDERQRVAAIEAELMRWR